MRPLRYDDHIRNMRLLDLLGLQQPEERAGHLDARERALLLRDIDREQQRLWLSRAEVHGVTGLPDGTLGDCSLSTDALRETLRILRSLHPVRL